MARGSVREQGVLPAVVAPSIRPVLGRRPALTGIRGVAAALVVFHHMGVSVLKDQSPFVVQAHGGYLGVEIFFVLSGFLITTSLLEQAEVRGGIDLRDFYRRRALRLGPALGALLVLWFAYLEWIDSSRARMGESLVVIGTYTTNYYKSADRDVEAGLGHLWTLAVEEQFYLLWPLLLLALLTLRVRQGVLLAVLGIAIAAITVNRAFAFGSADHLFDVYFRTDTHADGLLWGAALSVLWRSRVFKPARWQVLGVVVGLVFVGVAFGPALDLEPRAHGLSLTVCSMMSCVLVLCALHNGWLGRQMARRSLTYLGERSYAVYLWHVPALVLVTREASGPPALQAVAVLCLTLALAELSWRAVERPAIRWARSRSAFAKKESLRLG